MSDYPSGWRDGMTLAEVEMWAILAALKFHHGHRLNTAKSIGISIRTLSDRLSLYKSIGVEVSPPNQRIKPTVDLGGH